MASVMNSVFMCGFLIVFLLLTVFGIATLIIYVKEWMMKEKRPPIAGLMLHQLVYFNTLFDYQTFLARKYRTYRLVMASHSEIYTSDPVNVEYILKTNFSNYGKDMLMKSTLDSMFKVGFGVELNSLSGSDDFGNRFTKAFDDSNEIVFWRFVDPFWKIKRFLNIGLEASLKKNIKVMDDFVFKLIKHKREQMKSETKAERSKDDILSRFLIESEKDVGNMTDRYLRDIILNFMVAGKDTSANTLTWFFYMLCKNPFIQEKIAQEVNEATNTMGNDISINEFTESITEEALEKMQYLHAALTETIRLYPAVPVDGKNSDEEDILPDGLRVRKGDGMNYMPYAMGRMTYIWGDDAEDFRPERWLENGVFRPESPFKFTAFQAGPRICLGKEFAYRQMKIFAAILLNFFKLKLGDEKKEAKYRTMFTLQMDQGLHVFAFHRLKNCD